MASQGYHKNLTSKNPALEIRRAGKQHDCCGVVIERGARPGPMQDVWMWGRSKRCQSTIRQGTLYVGNKMLPPRLRQYMKDFGGWLPLCLHCAMDSYSEYFEGPDKIKYLQPMTPERRQKVVESLQRLITESEDMRVA